MVLLYGSKQLLMRKSSSVLNLWYEQYETNLGTSSFTSVFPFLGLNRFSISLSLAFGLRFI